MGIGSWLRMWLRPADCERVAHFFVMFIHRPLLPRLISGEKQPVCPFWSNHPFFTFVHKPCSILGRKDWIMGSCKKENLLANSLLIDGCLRECLGVSLSIPDWMNVSCLYAHTYLCSTHSCVLFMFARLYEYVCERAFHLQFSSCPCSQSKIWIKRKIRNIVIVCKWWSVYEANMYSALAGRTLCIYKLLWGLCCLSQGCWCITQTERDGKREIIWVFVLRKSVEIKKWKQRMRDGRDK